MIRLQRQRPAWLPRREPVRSANRPRTRPPILSRWRVLVPRTRTERTIVATAAVVAVAATAVVGLAAWRERAHALDDGASAANRLAHVLEEQSARAVQAVDLTLAGIVDALRLTPTLPAHDAVFEDMLRRRRDQLPQVRALFVVGPDGYITQDTDRDTPHVGVADRGYFQAHVRDARRGLYVGPPLVSRSVGTWFVSLSRRLDAPDGSFAGVVVAAVEPRYFERFYRELSLGPQDTISLFERDGTLIARHPHHGKVVGKSYAHLSLFRTRLPESRVGTFRARGFDGVPRIFSYRTVENLPLVVTVGLAETGLLAAWRHGTLTALAVTAMATALVGVLAVLLVRQARQRESARLQQAETQKLEALGRMTGGIAHDFGNVLSAIAMNLEVLRRTVDGRPGRAVEAAADAVRQGMALASRLLAFARRQELQVEAVDANRLVSELEPLIRHATSNTAAIAVDLAPDLWFCLTDESQLGVALVNLVTNSRDATTPGNGRVRIVTRNWTVDARRAGAELAPGDYVGVSVIDDGEGMPPDVLRRATEPFFTTKGRRGTGLGLSQVYGFVRQVGGALRIESAPGAGTAVHLLFPRAPDGAALTGTGNGR